MKENGKIIVMQEIVKKEINISDFPPKLRKLGQFIISSGQLMTLKEACEATGINYQTVRTQILRCKKKGLNFHGLVDDYVIEKLRNARPDVYKSLQEYAISGSHTHQKLFAQIVGDLKDKLEIDHKITGLFAVYSAAPGQVPADIKQLDPKEVQVVDLDYDND